VTTQNEYLSIAGFEAFTGAKPAITTRVFRPASQEVREPVPRTIKTGGRGASGNYNVPANTKCGINQKSVSQSTNYGGNSYPASNAFSGGSKFTHTNQGRGQWW
jgi:hypothetical protein